MHRQLILPLSWALLAWVALPVWAQEPPEPAAASTQVVETQVVQTPARPLDEEALLGKWDLDLRATQSFLNLGFTQGIQTIGPRSWWLLADGIFRSGVDGPQGPSGFWAVENGQLLLREPGQADIAELQAEVRDDVLTVYMAGQGDGRKLIFKRDKTFGQKSDKENSDDERLADDSAFSDNLEPIVPTELAPLGLIATVLDVTNTTVNNLPILGGLGAGDLTQGVTTLLLPDGTVMTLDGAILGLDPTGGALVGTLTDTVAGTGSTLNSTLTGLTSPTGTIGSITNTATNTVDNTVNTVVDLLP